MERAVFDSAMANKYYWIRPRLNLIRQRPQNHHSSGCKEDKAPSLLVVCQTKAVRGMDQAEHQRWIQTHRKPHALSTTTMSPTFHGSTQGYKGTYNKELGKHYGGHERATNLTIQQTRRALLVPIAPLPPPSPWNLYSYGPERSKHRGFDLLIPWGRDGCVAAV